MEVLTVTAGRAFIVASSIAPAIILVIDFTINVATITIVLFDEERCWC